MLSIGKCRKILGLDKGLTDDEIEEARDLFMALVDALIRAVQKGNEERKFERVVERFPEFDREVLEERIAIREHEGGLERDKAERLTIQEYMEGKMH